MALSDPYATAADLKDRFGIPDADSDDLIDAALLAASRQVDKICHRQFNGAGSATERTFDPLSPNLVLVDDFHTTAGLLVDSVAWDVETYPLEPRSGVIDGDPGWPFWRIRSDGLFSSTVMVTAQWGWADVPAPIVDATLQIAAELFKIKDAPFGVAGFGDFGAVRVRENPRIKSLLMPYRRHAAVVA